VNNHSAGFESDVEGLFGFDLIAPRTRENKF